MSIVLMAVGSMGKGKTKFIVDMSLSLQNQFRDSALELMDRNMIRFPHFNFQAFEASLRELIKLRKLKNLAYCREHIREIRKAYEKEPSPELIWGYDFSIYPEYYNNGVSLISFWKMLENYAQEYFVYSMTVCTIISNIAIRSDVEIIDRGYFESFNDDFFKRDVLKQKDTSSYARIIDFDLFRVGCQMIKDSNIAGSFEFGVILVSEIGKERKNALELQETKRNSDKANQKNDLFNEWLKMIRHAATIEGVCFVRFLCDEQRPESWGADARELATILHVQSVSEQRLALRFAFLSYYFNFLLLPKYYKWYNKVKTYGNENTYVVIVLHNILSSIYAKCDYKLNFYGYVIQTTGHEAGTLNDVLELHKYYLMFKKIYADRYSTDCFKDGFAQKALMVGSSLYDMPAYKKSCAVVDELSLQNSYMANTFIKMYLASRKE